MPSLYVIQGRDQGRRFELEGDLVTIGRVAGNAIQLRDTEVSREHARLVRAENRFSVCDLGSSNGTFVNGNRVAESELVSGDQIQLGRTLMLYTGFATPSATDIAQHVAIIGSDPEDDGSRIVHSVSHSEGSRIFSNGAEEGESPWLARARSNLQIMYRTALAVSHTLDIEELLTRILEMIFEWVNADRGCIMLKDANTGSLGPRVRKQRDDRRADDQMAISQTILDYVTANKEGVLTSNAKEDERWDPAQSIVKLGIREAICVPMQGRYDMVGAIYIDTSVPSHQVLAGARRLNQFTEEHLKLMIAIAHQAALAVEDTFYYKAMVQAERLAAVGQAMASLSHHVKNILQGIRGGSYLIELGLNEHGDATDKGPAGAPEKAAEAVETIRKGWGIVEKNQQRISSLVMDMLTFSKEREPLLELADLNAVAAEVVELMQRNAQQGNVRITQDFDERLPPFKFDAEGIHRAILNIVSNAIDACEGCDDGKITVSTSFVEGKSVARIVVRDNGPGIAAEEQPKIFNAFHSSKGSRGTGLGLPVSQKILHEHGGQISVESEPGSGTSFTLELPAPEGGNTSDAEDVAEVPGVSTLGVERLDR